jgi:hypothetical protein
MPYENSSNAMVKRAECEGTEKETEVVVHEAKNSRGMSSYGRYIISRRAVHVQPANSFRRD